MEDKIIICRCEDLTLGDIREVIKAGHVSLEEIKRLTRCGMGLCQGRTCRDLVLQEISRLSGKKIAAIEMTTFRPPVKPVKLRSLLGETANA